MTDWFETSLGRSLLQQERRYCRKLVPSGYYPSSLQVGRSSLNFLDGIETGGRFFVGRRVVQQSGESGDSGDGEAARRVHCALSKSSAMPFADKTHNLIILPHTLDFCTDPHGVLREMNQILIPQGCVVITGFNPFSLWGAVRLLRKVSRRRSWSPPLNQASKRASKESSNQAAWNEPRSGHYYRVGRVQDWLSLLGFELVGARMMAYQPPLQNENWRRKLDFVDSAGARWWPGLGGVYIIVGRKKEIAVTGRSVTRLQWRRLLPGIAQPAVRNAASVPLKRVRGKR